MTPTSRVKQRMVRRPGVGRGHHSARALSERRGRCHPGVSRAGCSGEAPPASRRQSKEGTEQTRDPSPLHPHPALRSPAGLSLAEPEGKPANRRRGPRSGLPGLKEGRERGWGGERRWRTNYHWGARRTTGRPGVKSCRQWRLPAVSRE